MNPDAELPTEVLRARERFLSTGSLDDERVRPGVLDSWRRSKSLRVHPDRVDLPFVREPDIDSPLVIAAAPVLQRIAEDLAEQPVSVILTSADGVVLERLASDATIVKALDAVRLAPGYSYAEKFVGTNGIGTALEIARPTYIHGGEHYLGTLGRLACAGSPIRDPMTRRMVGVIDLTCWAAQSNPLLYALAKSAGNQIEDRMRALANESETALLEAYLQHCRRFPLGVLAIGGDVVLMNHYLRETLDASDQAALLEHANDLRDSAIVATGLATLPSGSTARISAVHRSPGRGGGGNFVFHVQIAADTAGQRSPVRAAGPVHIPGLAGRSSSWRRGIQQVERCYRDRDWVVIQGESGSGRARLGQAVAQHVSPERTVRVLRIEDFCTTEDFIAEADAETDSDDFAVVVANVDDLPDEALEPLAAILQERAGRGWIAATMGAKTRSPLVDLLMLPFFTHTVTVPALRHRIEDLEDLVPLLLKELTRGADVHLGPDAMRQLAKLPWPGNVAQLRKVLVETVSLQRSGTIGADKLPAECRSLARRKLTQLEALERDAIVRSLQENGGSKAEAAESLGMSRATIYRKIKEFGIA
jgi:sigma-54 dependent transcriptional regulator, acetoin dehydrogenase operon transcriptional activator AcoR